MYNLYIDEKGPQNTFKKSVQFSMQEKISLGSDKMHSFVANALLLPKKNINVIEKTFTELEKNYISKILAYKEIIQIIKKYNYVESKPTNTQNFDWSKFTYALDLWISEIEYHGEYKKENINIFLDEGIKKEYLEVLKFNNVEEDMDSKESVGLRMTDHLVVLIGNYMSKLKADSFYSPENPDKIRRISNGWFELNNAQFQLIKRVCNFFLENNNRYFLKNSIAK